LVITTPALWNLVVRKFREHPVGRELMRPRDLADRQRKERREAELASRHGANPVVRALQQDDANALAHMIRVGQANPFVNNPQDGSTMLHMATRLGKLSCVKMLCQVLKEAGKHLNAKDVNGSSPLHLASFYGFSACAEHLLEHGADPNEQMVQGDTPVIQAAWNGHNDIIKLLIAAGANANKAKRDGSTALQLAVIRHQHDTVGLLLEQPNVDRALHNTQGNSAVHLACNVGCRQALEMLIVLAVEKRGTKKSDDIHKLLRQKNEGGMAPLHLAAYNGHDELVRIILSTCDTLSEKQELANMRTMPGWTALHAAVERGFLPVVTVLLEEGLADPTAIRLQDGSTPVHISCTMNTSKHHAILRAIIKAIHLRLKSDQAATEGKTDVEVRGLLQQILRKKDTQGFEALNFAIRSPTAMMTLLDHGCDVNTPDGRDGVTPLLQACDSPRPNLCLDVVVRLIARGANVNVRLHANGNGPLHLAAKSGSLEIVRELLAAGADPAYKNVGGIDAATMARQATHIACAELIEESLAPRF
jgi:ankyrin repeat protein